MTLKKAIFLDRDGVINRDVGYPSQPEHIVFEPYIFEFCHKMQAAGYMLIVITNQAGIAKGKFSEEAVVNLHQWMSNEFAIQGITIVKFYYCPFHKSGTVPEYTQESELRKPRPGMILKAVNEFGIDVLQSFMIGDKASDRIQLEGLRSIIIKSKYIAEGYDVERLEEVEGVILSGSCR